jgi:hypothetical protein
MLALDIAQTLARGRMDMLIMFREDPAPAAGYFANYVRHTGVIAGRAREMLRQAVAERDATAAATTQNRAEPKALAGNIHCDCAPLA